MYHGQCTGTCIGKERGTYLVPHIVDLEDTCEMSVLVCQSKYSTGINFIIIGSLISTSRLVLSHSRVIDQMMISRNTTAHVRR